MNTSLVTSLALKTASMVLIISTLVDVIFNLLPYQFGDGKWWSQATLELVNRGLLPLVGIVFWAVGDWIETVSKDGSSRNSGIGSLGVAILATVLGVLFFVITPFQAWSGNSAREQVVAKTKEKLAEAEAQGKKVLASVKDTNQVKQQLAAIDAQIKEGKVQGVALEQLKAYKANLEDPNKITAQVNKELEEIRKQLQARNDQATSDMWKVSIRTSLASLLLSAGYSFIGLTGLRRAKR
jgi:hypothetical protein